MSPADYGFSFGVAFTDIYGRAIKIDPTYFTLSFEQGTTIYSGSIPLFIKTDLGYKL